MRNLVALLLAAFAAFPIGAPAQVTSATVTGIVRDPSGAAIPGVKLVITNVGTNLGRESMTDDTGSYTVPALNPGTYRIEAEKEGFKKASLSGIVLQVAQEARVDIALQLGQVSETVSVEATAPLIETENPGIGGVITESRVVNLPLKGRNFMELTALNGGINEGNSSTAKAGILNRGFAPSAAGMPATENNYQLDGADNKEAFFNTFNQAPSVDAVKEFRIQIGQYSAEFGAGGGAVVNVITKSGTNEFHGAAWEFVRNNEFDARNFFLLPNQKIAPLKQNQFGAALGGPVIKNRTFFFGNFDLTRTRKGYFNSANVPTDAQRAGNFSGYATTLIDPVTGSPFPNNIIPSSRINPISAGIVKYYPQPNNLANPLQNYVVAPSGRDDLDSYLIRIDHQLANKHNLFGRVGNQSVDRFTPGTYPTVGGQLQPQRFMGAVLGLTSTFRPSLLNEARFNYSRTVNRTKGQNTGTPVAADLGVPFAQRDSFNSGFVESIGISRSPISSIGEGQPWFLTVNTFQWYDGITWIRGSHTIKAGADIRRVRADAALATHANNSYTFTGQFTGDGFADFLLGAPGSELLELAPNHPGRFRRTEMGYYVLDDWKATPNLTLNIGLRYEFNTVPRELGGLTPTFDPSLGNGVGGLRYPKQNTTALPFYQTIRPDLPVGLLDRETQFNSDKNNLAPRFGFAWRPWGNSQTVVRGGYGWYYSSAQLINIVQNSVTGPPAQFWPTYASDPRTPTLGYGGPSGVPLEQAFRTATFGVLTGPENHWLEAYTQQWSMSVGRTMGKTFSLEAQYLGSKSTHVENSFDYNFAAPNSTPLVSKVPYPKWGRVFGFSSGAGANYNALLVTAEKRMGGGFAFRGSYTYGKALTRGGGRITGGNIGQSQNPANPRSESGHTIDDINHRFTASYLYELPIGAGKPIGRNVGRATDRIVGGWVIAGITTFRTGFYLTPTVGAANCNSAFNNPCRPDLIGPALLGGSGVDAVRFDRNAFDWPLNTARHAAQAPRFGSAGPNILRGNGINNFDLSLHKEIPIREQWRLEFRFESFNAFNHANFSNPSAGPESPQFGRTFSTQTDPRINQLGLKMYW